MAYRVASTTAGDESAPSLPPSTALARLTCSRLYNMLVARHFALPTAFAKDSTWCAQSHQPKDGRWRELLEATTDAETAKELQSILRDMRTSALPRVSAQHLYQVAVNGLPIGNKVGSRACPLCGSQHDDAAHLIYGCDTSRQLWALALLRSK